MIGALVVLQLLPSTTFYDRKIRTNFFIYLVINHKCIEVFLSTLFLDYYFLYEVKVHKFYRDQKL